MPTPDETRLAHMRAEPTAVVWTMSAMGEITYVSPSIEQVRGFTPAEAMAQGPDAIHPPESLRASLAYFEQFSRDVLAGRAPQAFHGDLEYLCKDGSTVWCEVLAVPVLGTSGEVLELQGVSVPRPVA